MLDKQELARRMDAFQARCREEGLRITPQRMAIYKALLETDQHPSAETVFRQVRRSLPTISLDTVNRTLLTLSDMGLALVVEGSGDAKRFDAEMSSHQHFRCVKCRRIIDFHYEPFDQIHVPENLVARFTVLRTTAYIEGVCDRCGRTGE